MARCDVVSDSWQALIWGYNAGGGAVMVDVDSDCPHPVALSLEAGAYTRPLSS